MKLNRTWASLAVAGTLALATASATPALAHESTHAARDAGRTTVVLNPTLVPALVDPLGVQTVAPGRLTASSDGATVSFPITKVKGGVISHAGGLRFTPVGGGELQITRFDVNTNTGYLTAATRLDGAKLGRVNIFALGPVQEIDGRIPACDGVAAGLSLTQTAADALGVPALGGAFIGDACVVPRTHQGGNG